MKRILQVSVIILIIAFLIGCTSCSTDQSNQNEPIPPEPSPKEELCGNNVCDDFEYNIGNCPEDCADVGEGIVYLGFMIHLEGWEEPDGSISEFKYNAWTERATDLATVLEEYGAKGTFEARHELVLASELYEDDTLVELYNRGHGIGVHADLGGTGARNKGTTQEEFTNEMEEMRIDMERVTGLDIRHVSGICSELDWVEAALDAGYEFTTGGVNMCGLSLDEENLPKGYTKKDLSSDGVLEGIYEQYQGTAGHTVAVFDQNDIDTFIGSLEESIALSRSDRVNQMYVALSIGDGMDESVARDWLEAIEPYVESGQVEWKTLPEIYDEYVAWEATS